MNTPVYLGGPPAGMTTSQAVGARLLILTSPLIRRAAPSSMVFEGAGSEGTTMTRPHSMQSPAAEPAVITVGDIRIERINDTFAGTVRYRVKEQAGYFVEVIPMLVNWRLHIVKVDGGELAWSHRHWCYDGLGRTAFTAAVLAAHAWDVADETEPQGWIKSWDGRRNGEGPTVPRS